MNFFCSGQFTCNDGQCIDIEQRWEFILYSCCLFISKPTKINSFGNSQSYEKSMMHPELNTHLILLTLMIHFIEIDLIDYDFSDVTKPQTALMRAMKITASLSL